MLDNPISVAVALSDEGVPEWNLRTAFEPSVPVPSTGWAESDAGEVGSGVPGEPPTSGATALPEGRNCVWPLATRQNPKRLVEPTVRHRTAATRYRPEFEDFNGLAVLVQTGRLSSEPNPKAVARHVSRLSDVVTIMRNPTPPGVSSVHQFLNPGVCSATGKDREVENQK
jgi:hypothetical protein